MNFGVGGYGMGQAFLRWLHLGAQFQPDIVIFGLQPENLKRNVNVFRQMLVPAGMPFSKPRFALIAQELTLLNAPTLPPEQLTAVFEDFAESSTGNMGIPLPKPPSSGEMVDLVSPRGISVRSAKRKIQTIKTSICQTARGECWARRSSLPLGEDVIARDAVFITVHLPLRSHLVRRFESRDRAV